MVVRDPRGVAERLEGGITNRGAVVREGDHVVRPAGPHTAAVHSLLATVRRAGFTGAPAPVGVDPDGRERLEFITGDVPSTPYPDWAQSDRALTSVAVLMRRFHDAARGFDPRRHDWNTALADPRGGPVACHNDTELSNVVFRGGLAVALIDFEFAAPGRPVYDVAQFARVCVPIDNEFDRHRLGWVDADRPARLRLIADSYGLTRAGRNDLLDAIDDALEQIERAARRSIAGGDAAAVATVERTGGLAKYDRRRDWWTANRHAFGAALR